MTSARLSRPAQRDVQEAVGWIFENHPGAAGRFVDSVEAALARLGEYPMSGSTRVHITARPLRFWPLSGFPYILVYDVAVTPPVVMRVLHGARDFKSLLG
jgi:toxin ParE1/3/4